MQNLDFSFAQDPNTLALAIIYGMIPAIAWVFFWLRENRERKRRNGILAALFFGGALMVVAVLPVQEWIARLSTDPNVLNVLWAASEEVLKFGIFALIVLRNSSKTIIDPIDYPIYIMIAALGFAGFENALYFLAPLQAGNTTSIILSGSMRFLGTTLLHAASSSLIGISLGFAYFKSKRAAAVYGFIGIIAAITLHSTFNFFIVQNNEQNFFQIFGFLWVATIVIMIMLEWIRKMGSVETRLSKEHLFFKHLEELFEGVLALAGIAPTDPSPVANAFTQKGFAPDGPEFRKLKTLLSSLRSLEAAYLGTQESTAEKPTDIARVMIPDTVSAKVIGDAIMRLKTEVTRTMQNASAVEFNEVPVVRDTPITASIPKIVPPPVPVAPMPAREVKAVTKPAQPAMPAAPAAIPIPVPKPAPAPIPAPPPVKAPAPLGARGPIPMPAPALKPMPKPADPSAPVFAADPFGQLGGTPPADAAPKS